MSMESPNRTTGAAGPEVTVTEARGAQRTGRAIWILAISLGLAVILLLGYTLLHAPKMGAINHPQARDVDSRDISTFNTPAGSARSSPGTPTGSGNAQ